MFQIGFLELLVITTACLLVFGPDKLPEIIKSIIKSISRLKHKLFNMKEDLKSDIGADEIQQDIFNELKMDEINKQTKDD